MTVKKTNAWVFDLDDTLMSNVHDYANPILDACRMIIEFLGDSAPHVSAIIALEQEIDSGRVNQINLSTGQPYGYSMERFPGSLVEVYKEICRRSGKFSLKSVESAIYSVGMGAYDSTRHEKNVYPGVFNVLNFIQAKGDLVLLLTKGDKRVQSKKLAVLDAGKRFFRVRIVDNKSPDTFKEMSEGLERYNLFSVGNDYEKDILPAFGAGYAGVWIPVETWEVVGRLEAIRQKVDWEKCTELKSINNLIDQYDKIVGVDKL